MSNRWGKLIAIAGAAIALITVVVLAASAGSKEDPLVTLSYLEGTYTNSIMKQTDEALVKRNQELKDTLAKEVEKLQNSGGAVGGNDSAAAFVVVTLEKGETLVGSVGTEVMLRSGSGVCKAASDPGLIDSSDGTTLSKGGALKANHLYLMTVEGRGVTATSSGTMLLVRGEYRLES